MNSPLTNERGLTIMEVLISSVVFMIGFSILVALLTNSLTRFSSRELNLASSVGQEAMTLALASPDAESCDTIIVRSSIRFGVHREVLREGDLTRIRITVDRTNSRNSIVDFYHECTTTDE